LFAVFYIHIIGYSNELSECLSFIEEVLDNGLPSVVMGDMNFSFVQCGQWRV